MMIIPDVVSAQSIKSLRPHQSAAEAGQLMIEFDISAVIVVDDGEQLLGIVTERDLSRRVVAADRQGSQVTVAEIMTENPAFLRPEDSAAQAMNTMQEMKIRHLPVVEDERVVGIVSIRDLRDSLSRRVVTV